MKPDSMRVLSLSLVATALLAAGLAFETLYRVDRSQSAGDERPPADSSALASTAAGRIPERQPDGAVVASPQPGRGVINKCTVAGRTVYSDQPCAAGVGAEFDLHADSAGLAPILFR